MTPYYYCEARDCWYSRHEIADICAIRSESLEQFCSEKGYYAITEPMCSEFYRDLLGTLGTSGNSGIMSEEGIAERMGINLTKAQVFLYSCAKFGITERQGGGWCV